MRCHKCALCEELGVLEPGAHPALCNHDGCDESVPFSPISVPRVPPMPGLMGFKHLRELQNFLGFDLPHSDAGSTFDAWHSLAGWLKAFWTHPSPSDIPCPFSMCRHHPRCVPRALHVSQPQPQPHACAAAPFNVS